MSKKQEKRIVENTKQGSSKVAQNSKQTVNKKMFAGGGYDISNNSINCNNVINNSASEWKEKCK